MKEHAANKAQGEWTAQMVNKMLEDDNEQSWQVVADAHNATLAAGREKVQQLLTGLHRLYALRDPTCQQQAERAYEAALAKEGKV